MTDQLIVNPSGPELNEAKVGTPTDQGFEIASWLVTLDVMSRLAGNIPRNIDNIAMLKLCDTVQAGRFRSFLLQVNAAGESSSNNKLREELYGSPFFNGHDPNDRSRHLVDENLALALRLYEQEHEAIITANNAGVGQLLRYVSEMSIFFAKELVAAFEPTNIPNGVRNIPQLNLQAMIAHKHGQARFFLRKYYEDETAQAV